jgi:hypothetical protein
MRSNMSSNYNTNLPYLAIVKNYETIYILGPLSLSFQNYAYLFGFSVGSGAHNL